MVKPVSDFGIKTVKRTRDFPLKKVSCGTEKFLLRRAVWKNCGVRGIVLSGKLYGGRAMRCALFIPPLTRMSGGLANLYRIADDLRALGREVALVCPGNKAVGFTEMVQRGFAAPPWEGLTLDPSDLWLVPESWPNAMPPGLIQNVPTVVYAQSWNFLLTTLPDGVSWKQLPVRFLAVSHPVAWFLEEVLGVRVSGLLPPALDPAFSGAGAARPARPVRVAWMPRKNKALAEQIRQIAEVRLSRYVDAPAVDWVPIHNLPPHGVAAAFASCHIYLNTAFPEGCGLPPLEAMATGCVPVGFTGFGGWEYMRQAAPGAYSPAVPLRETPWGGNGFFYADGDIMAAGLGLASAIRMAAANDEEWRTVSRAGVTTARHYTREAGKETLAALLVDLAGGE